MQLKSKRSYNQDLSIPLHDFYCCYFSFFRYMFICPAAAVCEKICYVYMKFQYLLLFIDYHVLMFTCMQINHQQHMCTNICERSIFRESVSDGKEIDGWACPATIYKRELKAILKVPLGSLLSTSYPIDR